MKTGEIWLAREDKFTSPFYIKLGKYYPEVEAYEYFVWIKGTWVLGFVGDIRIGLREGLSRGFIYRQYEKVADSEEEWTTRPGESA